MLWLAVYFPLLGLEICLRQETRQVRRPRVLVEAQRIVMCNAEAQRAGIQVGSRLATAYSLVGKLVHYSRNPKAERIRLENLITTAYRFTSTVSIAGTDALLLEVQGSLALFGGLHSIVSQIKTELESRGHEVQMNAANTPQAAFAIARANLPLKLSDFPTREELEYTSYLQLDDVPLACTELPPKSLERLYNMGLTRLGEIIQLPRKELATRFNKELMRYIAQVCGDIYEPWPRVQLEEKFVADLHITDPIRNKVFLEHPMQRLTEELIAWLRTKYEGTTGLRWRFENFEHQRCDVELRFAEPQATPEVILKLSHLKLERLELPEDVLSIRLENLTSASMTTVEVGGPHLFGDVDAAYAAGPTELLDRLTTRLGREALQVLCSRDDHRPEYAGRSVVSEDKPHDPKVSFLRTGNKRPLWLFSQPTRIELSQYELLSRRERVQSGWWEQMLARDYFVARNRHGAYCWLFHDDRGWYLHGYFA